MNLQAALEHKSKTKHSTFPNPINFKHEKRNLIIYHIIYDLSNDIIYGCGLATGVLHDRLVGGVLLIMIFSEGFRRHSRKDILIYYLFK